MRLGADVGASATISSAEWWNADKNASLGNLCRVIGYEQNFFIFCLAGNTQIKQQFGKLHFFSLLELYGESTLTCEIADARIRFKVNGYG